MEAVGLNPDQPKIVEVDAAIVHRNRSKSLVFSRRGGWTVGRDLETVLQQLFELR